MSFSFTIKDIHRYANKEFSEQELRNFEQYLDANPDFAQEVELVLMGMARQRHQQMLELRNNHVTKKETPRANNFIWLKIAASVVLILSVVGIMNLFLREKAQSPTELAMQHWNNTPIPQTEGLRMGNAQTSDQAKTLQTIQNYVAQKEYTLALDLLTTVPINSKILELEGICYMETKQYDKGVADFQKIIDNPNADNKDIARWRLALAYLIMQQNDKAQTTLQEIVNNQEPYSQEATVLLNNLHLVKKQ
jgi:tetratricopeptide (TPR) repeat protein